MSMIATPQRSLCGRRGQGRARRRHRPIILSDAIEGEARDVGRVHAGARAALARRGDAPFAALVLLSGGETTVTVRGGGRGGRNAEFLLGWPSPSKASPASTPWPPTPTASTASRTTPARFVTPDTLARAAALGLDPRALLADNDAYASSRALGDLVVTGPTLTNVNDFRAILVESGRRPRRLADRAAMTSSACANANLRWPRERKCIRRHPSGVDRPRSEQHRYHQHG